MTAWGSTPSCRGFDHFSAMYNAYNQYFTHVVGDGFDYHRDERCANKSGAVRDRKVQAERRLPSLHHRRGPGPVEALQCDPKPRVHNMQGRSNLRGQVRSHYHEQLPAVHDLPSG